MSAAPSWPRTLVYGLLFGVTMTASEALALPFGDLSWAVRVTTFLSIFPAWLITSVGIAWAAFTAERHRLSAWQTAALVLVLALALSAVQNAAWLVYRAFQVPIPIAELLGEPLPSWSNFYYHAWMSCFHGALFTAGCMLTMRAERTRHLLGDAEIARGKTEALLADAQLDALRARIDPAFLLRAMDEVQRRYTHDAPGADRLLDQLVGFLRLAMPGVRGGASTLDAELGLAQAYAHLDEQIEPLRARWRFDLDPVPPGLTFPPLLLLPLLDQLTPAQDGGRTGELQLETMPGELVLTIRGAGPGTRLAIESVHRMQIALRASFGNACSLWLNRPARHDRPTLVLRLTLAHPAHESINPSSTKKVLYA